MGFKVIKAKTDQEKRKAFEIREEVFVVEQEVPHHEEFDEFEQSAHHFVALNQEIPVGSARWRHTKKGVKMERFTVKKALRGQGLGSQIVRAVLEDITKHVKKGTYVYLHAQLDAVPLYAKFGFQKKGKKFDECGIMHYLMWKVL